MNHNSHLPNNKSGMNNVDYSLINNKQPSRILIVEDDLFTLDYLSNRLTRAGHKIITATNGQECLDILNKEHSYIDVILMDKKMPVLDGLETVLFINEDPEYKRIPVIMLTAAQSKEDILEAIEAGIYQYLTKPIDEAQLHTLITGAVRRSRKNKILEIKLRQHQRGLGHLETAKFQFRTITQAESLTAFIAHSFPEPEHVLWAICELMINSIEHGNLQVTQEEKISWFKSNTWRYEIDQRLELDEYREKQSTLTFARKKEGIYLIIEDQGTGFDWHKHLNTDVKMIDKVHGHSIAYAKERVFDHLAYNEKGNKVVAFIAV